MLTAHDLLLLLLDDESGRISPGVSEPDKAMAGAVLVDLATRGLIDVTDKGRLVVLSTEQPAEPALQRGLAVVQEREGSKPEAALGKLAKGLRDLLADELVNGGILRREEHKVMGLFRTNRLPANNNSYESELRSRLSRVLAGDHQPDERTGPLIALLAAMDVVTKVLVVSDRKLAKQRAKEIGRGDWAAAAVRKAVQATQAAVVASVVAASAAASSS